MLIKLTLLSVFATVLFLVWLLCMRATPRRGGMRVLERLCAGIILCYLCGLALWPFGFRLPQGPLGAAFAGYLGLPGVALQVLAGLWP